MKLLKVVFWRALEWPIALAWFLFATLIDRTARVESDALEPDGPAVFVNWHRYQSFLIAHHGKRRRWMLCIPVPQLEPVARYCKLMGLRLVRGASGERGKEAREELRRLLVAGDSVVLAVDGPHGPVFEAKRGCVDLARSAGVPIIPVAYRGSRAHEFRWRWDHTLMPLPFSRIEITHRPPIEATGSDEELLARVNAELNAMEAHTGRSSAS